MILKLDMLPTTSSLCSCEKLIWRHFFLFLYERLELSGTNPKGGQALSGHCVRFAYFCGHWFRSGQEASTQRLMLQE